VDLIYLDPPFNSNATYNVLFSQQNGSQSSAQIQAFEDTWQWDEEAARTYEITVEQGGPIADALRAFRILLGDSNMMAYLAMMAPRLVEMHRVLHPKGSLYLHCDSTASHYLKLLLDQVFSPEYYQNEIIWKRTSSHSDSKRYPKITDTIFSILSLKILSGINNIPTMMKAISIHTIDMKMKKDGNFNMAIW